MRRTSGGRGRRLGAGAVAAGVLVLATLPVSSPGADLGALGDIVQQVARVVEPVTGSAERLERERLERERLQDAQQAEEPETQPPLHGTNPHGQGTVGVIDLTPTGDRPTGADPAGSDSDEEVVVGRARGEQNEDGTYHGHITIASLFGNEILGVDTDEGEQAAGPLDPIQTGILDAVCDGSGNQICVEVLTADSATDENGSSNRFAVARATLGGEEGVAVGVAESNGNISDDGQCQTAHGDSSVADADIAGTAVADVNQSSTESRACKGQAPQQTNTSSVIGLGGAGVPLPDPGCADGTPDVITGVPVVAPVVCNADDTSTSQAPAPYGTRDALTVYLLDLGGAPLSKVLTASSESRAQAPPPQCSDTTDNDGDGLADAADPGCLSGPDGGYNPNDDNETDEPGTTQCSDTTDNDGDGAADAADPGCLSGPGGTYDPNDDDESDDGRNDTADDRNDDDDPACSDGRDNDGDGRSDRNDPGCLSGPGGSYAPNDRSEADGPAAECSDGMDNDGDGVRDEDDPGCLSGPGGAYDPDDDDESDDRREAGVASLPMTGADALVLLIAGVLMIGGGIELRRRLQPGTPA